MSSERWLESAGINPRYRHPYATLIRELATSIRSRSITSTTCELQAEQNMLQRQKGIDPALVIIERETADCYA